jgi:hypothetical protein
VTPVSARGPKEDRVFGRQMSGGLSPFRGRVAACYAGGIVTCRCQGSNSGNLCYAWRKLDPDPEGAQVADLIVQFKPQRGRKDRKPGNTHLRFCTEGINES